MQSSTFHAASPYNGAQDRTRNTTASTMSHHSLAGSGNMNHAWSNQGVSGPSASLNDSLSQSRTQYQPGYLLSLAHTPAGQQGAPRYDEPHLIPTRAKMNPSFPRNTTSDFGTESMFETGKHRSHEEMDDEDGPPMASVNDMINESFVDPHRFKKGFATPLKSQVDSHKQATVPPISQLPQFQTLYIVVFGYPAGRFSLTASLFQALAEGGTTEVEIAPDVENAFKMGYKLPWEAARALRKNGEVVSGDGGRWMVGVKWADATLAEQVLGSAAAFSAISLSQSPEQRDQIPRSTESLDQLNTQLQRVGSTPISSSNQTIGTPIQVAPSSSAFKRSKLDVSRKENSMQEGVKSSEGTPSKGVFGQVTDMIFGW